MKPRPDSSRFLRWSLGLALAGGLAAQPAPTATQQEAAVLAHLNSVLDWHRLMQSSDGWVMLPGDEFYKTNQHDLTDQALVGAFAYGRAMVAVMAGESAPAPQAAQADARASRLTTLAATNTERLDALRRQQAALGSRPGPVDANRAAQLGVVQAEIDLHSALGASLEKSMALFAANSAEAGGAATLAAQIAALQRTEPAVFDAGPAANAKNAPVAAAVAPPSDGLINRAVELFSLVRERRSIDSLVARTAQLQTGANGLAQPLAAELRSALQAGDDAGQGLEQMSDPAQLEQARRKIESVAARFRNLSAALMPLRQEAMALQNTGSNLAGWKRSLASQSDLILRDLFARAIALAVALIVLVTVSEVWRRATFKYVRDPRRRRQLLLVRRFATGLLMGIVIIMGFVSDFSSLATFAGFITAGIAVALQTIILSVAAYFFLIGRYGVKVGDRVTVSGVTGDVIDIGLVRVFLMELAGTGVNLHPTGRVVVLANSALFSSTPLYKQLPGTDYAWHEVYVTMAGDADSAPVEALLLRSVNRVYGGYRASIELQHGALERLLDFKTDLPAPVANVRLTDAGLEVVVRYPVEIRKMPEVDDAVTREVLAAVRGDEALRKTLTALPRIRAAVKS